MASVGPILGVGSQLDLGTLLNNLMAAEAIPLTKLQSQEANVQAKISAYGQMSSALSTLRDAAKELTAEKFNGATGASSDSKVATMKATNEASKASYALDIETLATAEKSVSAALTGSDALVSPGELNFTFGKVEGGVFVPSDAEDAEVKTVTIEPGKNTLADVRDAINDAEMGVTASLINDGSGTRLVLTSNKTGAENAFKIETEDGGGAGTSLSYFDYDPASAADYVAGNPTTQATRLERAVDAKFTLDGLALTNASNEVEDAVEGVTLTLLTTGTSKMTVSTNPDAARATAQKLVTAFNTFLSTVNKLAVNIPSETLGQAGTAGPLAGDSLVRDVTNRIRNEIFTPVKGATGAYTSLASIGLSFQTDGTLKLDATRFDKAMATDASAIAKLFDTEPFGEGSQGISERFVAQLENVVKENGSIDVRVDGLDSTTERLQDQQEQLKNRLVMIEKRYRDQFSSLDSILAGLNSTGNFLAQQLDALANLRGA